MPSDLQSQRRAVNTRSGSTKKMKRRMKAKPSASRRNLCVVIHGNFAADGRTLDCNEFNFYIVEPGGGGGGEEYTPVEPTIQFQALRKDSPTVAFCALNSTIYMFEGDDVEGKSRLRDNSTFDGKYAGKFKITPKISSGCCYKMGRKDLISIKPMHETKNCPVALPTPDGKNILVFSSEAYCTSSWGWGCYVTSFEIYNVAHNTWEVLPPMPRSNYHPSDSHTFGTYGFVSDSIFLLQSTEGLVLRLDLRTLKWSEHLFARQVPSPWDHGRFFGVDGLCFTPFGAYPPKYGRQLGQYCFQPPLSDFFTDDRDYVDDDDLHLRPSRMVTPCIVPLDYGCDGRDIVFGVVQAQRPSGFIKQYYRVARKQHGLSGDEYNKHRSTVSAPILPYNNLHVLIDIRRVRQESIDKYKKHDRVLEPDGPLLNTIEFETIKLQVDFDFDKYACGMMEAFSI